MRIARYHTRKIAASVRLIVVGLVICLFVYGVDSRLRPTIQAAETACANNYAMTVIYEAVEEALEQVEADYDYFVELSYDAEGRVTAIESNVQQLNGFQADLALSIAHRLEQLRDHHLAIPLGTLTGIAVFGARGPDIPMDVAPYGYPQVTIVNQFDEAGVNQTLHRIVADVSVQITAAIPGFPVDVLCSARVVLAETVIVGTVPQLYAELTGDGKQLGAMYSWADGESGLA